MNIMLTENQTAFGCELPKEFMPINKIKRRMSGYCCRVSWKKLVKLGIAEQKEAQQLLKRGQNWNNFFNKHGHEDTESGCLIEDIATELPDFSFIENRPRKRP
jgi:hypothetical protein